MDYFETLVELFLIVLVGASVMSLIFGIINAINHNFATSAFGFVIAGAAILVLEKIHALSRSSQ